MPRPPLPRPPRAALPYRVRALEPASEAWSRLERLPDPPERLFVAGHLPPLERAVAIVGTRRADPEARAFARALAFELASAGSPILSGGALGVDGQAHQGALDAGGASVAVLPLALEEPYPEEHLPLFRELLGAGALLSEVAPGGAIGKWRFLARNRLLAALAEVVVVVQAPLRSGALSTAAVARQLGRPLLVVPSAPWDRRAEGGRALLAEGRAQPCHGARDVQLALEGWATAPPLPPARRRRRRASSQEREAQASLLDPALSDPALLGPSERAVYEALGAEPAHPDQVAERAALPIEEVQRALLLLTLEGLARHEGAAGYRRAF